MPIIPPRFLPIPDFSTPQQAMELAQAYLNRQDTNTVLNVLERAAQIFPPLYIQFLALAYDVYVNIPDRSRYALYQSRIFDFAIKPNDKVLDMGSGHIPFPLATHLADISITDDAIGRNGAKFVNGNGKPVYECSVEKTPFADKEFDFVYCAHLLEHSDNPAAACKELIRIGKRGYIETPTKGKDIFMNFARQANHYNYVELIGDVLTFVRYQDWEVNGIGFDILGAMNACPQNDREKAFSALLNLRTRNINTMLLWENDFKYEVRGKW